MRGISTLYCLACEREGCLTNSRFVEFCRALDTSEDCPTLLDFRDNYLSDTGAAAILRTVAIMRWVRAVDLRGCGAGLKSVQALADVAVEHPHLRCVDLRGECSDVFVMSGRRLLVALRLCPKLVVHVNYDDFPATMAQKLREANQRNAELQQEEDAAIAAEKMAAMPVLDSLNAAAKDEDLFYLPKHDRDGVPLYDADSSLLPLVDNLNEYMEDYLQAYQYVGRAAALLAVDLGAAILPCIRATAVAVPPSAATSTGRVYPTDVMMSVRAVDALLGGLRANPFILEELVAARGAMNEMYVAKLKEMRGEYESLVADRLGSCPSYRERRLEKEMRPVYDRIVAGISQRSMVDMPSMGHVEEHLRQVRADVLNRLLEGRQRVLPALLAQVRYFAYNRPAQAKAWADSYVRYKEKQQVVEEEEEGGETEEREERKNVAGQAALSAADQLSGESPQRVKMCVAAMNDLREVLQDPYTEARYAVTRPLSEALPMEMRMFLCDLALRRGASLYTPRVFSLVEEEEEKEGGGGKEEGQQQGSGRLEGRSEDPFDIVRIFERVRGRRDLSEVLCAFDEWYRLRQVECYDVRHVSRQELLAAMSQM
ncbi:hypothetical protein DQ04_05201030 [Trypanosoma grayi]|uniref:hypothetical protein n=1 Tax=Trypanosoma grayi TaxID=71804 RepID=UPI0004F45029|nr:hypothetical protein DQ04_05201030 [Trypanosoma grayi]KEG09451.1 hypothetical protein DQ04_05201030 [Trypanosoma grayi]